MAPSAACRPRERAANMSFGLEACAMQQAPQWPVGHQSHLLQLWSPPFLAERCIQCTHKHPYPPPTSSFCCTSVPTPQATCAPAPLSGVVCHRGPPDAALHDVPAEAGRLDQGAPGEQPPRLLPPPLVTPLPPGHTTVRGSAGLTTLGTAPLTPLVTVLAHSLSHISSQSSDPVHQQGQQRPSSPRDRCCRVFDMPGRSWWAPPRTAASATPRDADCPPLRRWSPSCAP
jgi:hypothetical protein